jgi:hypothetical protein
MYIKQGVQFSGIFIQYVESQHWKEERQYFKTIKNNVHLTFNELQGIMHQKINNCCKNQKLYKVIPEGDTCIQETLFMTLPNGMKIQNSICMYSTISTNKIWKDLNSTAFVGIVTYFASFKWWSLIVKWKKRQKKICFHQHASQHHILFTFK